MCVDHSGRGNKPFEEHKYALFCEMIISVISFVIVRKRE